MATGLLYDLARMGTATTGTGTITLGAAISGYLTFALAGVTDGQTVSYGIRDGANSEVGTGVYTSSGTTLTRNVIVSTNSNSAINLSGAAEVFITALATDIVRTFNSRANSAGNITPTTGDYDITQIYKAKFAGGRLTITSGTPVLTASTSGQNTVYYTPGGGSGGNLISIYDGTRYVTYEFGELSQLTTDATKSPAACANNSNYDMFVWSDSGTLRCTRGPAWSGDTSRGTGAGTTQISLFNGLYYNSVDITNGPAANRGRYVGTIRTNGSALVEWTTGAVASGGAAGIIGIWNLYNQVPFTFFSGDTTDSWAYSTGTWREANNQTGMQCSYIAGLNMNDVCAIYNAQGLTATTAGSTGIGYDSTTAFVGSTGTSKPAVRTACPAVYRGLPGLGFHYVAAIEYGATGVSYYGDNGGTTDQTGLYVTGWY